SCGGPSGWNVEEPHPTSRRVRQVAAHPGPPAPDLLSSRLDGGGPDGAGRSRPGCLRSKVRNLPAQFLRRLIGEAVDPLLNERALVTRTPASRRSRQLSLQPSSLMRGRCWTNSSCRSRPPPEMGSERETDRVAVGLHGCGELFERDDIVG